jgi:hypothetical protein
MSVNDLVSGTFNPWRHPSHALIFMFLLGQSSRPHLFRGLPLNPLPTHAVLTLESVHAADPGNRRIARPPIWSVVGGSKEKLASLCNTVKI